METARSVSDSHEWEETCMQLLAIRYGDELQLIDPSRAGDLGLEAFTRDTGRGFQCYSPLEPLSAKERYEKHRDKLTRDLRKLEMNEEELVVILGSTTLTRYVFMVPQFDKRLLEHCGNQCMKMKAKKLRILHHDFDIVVHTKENYPRERAQLIELALEPLQLEIADVDEVARAEWAAANVALVKALTGKIATFQLPDAQGEELRDEFLTHYLRREHLLAQIFNEAPETHVRLEARIRQRERLLAAARLMDTAPPLEHATAVIRDLARELLEESKALQATGADALAYGTAADWMVRCPLDFN
jgi:hypothetical protein